jgi:predicted transcriptional regulator
MDPKDTRQSSRIFPSQTIFVTLELLREKGYAEKNEDGRWTITPKGAKALWILRKLQKLNEQLEKV